MPRRPQFVNKREFIQIEGTKIPHWNQVDRVQFVTFRLADSLPQLKLMEYRQEKELWLGQHPKPWDEAMQEEYDAMFTAKLDKWIDAGYGGCILKDSRVRDIVADSIMHLNGDRYDIYAYVIMPNHVHVMLTPRADCTVQHIVGGWKRYSSQQANKLLGHNALVWERNCFDRLMRSAADYDAHISYIVDNPQHLPSEWYSLFVAE
jgi:REP element-mobilizing transposase RayT